MPTILEVLHEAVKLHESGNFAAAEHLYREILGSDPRHSDACHLLGLALFQRGDTAAALEWIGRAIEVDPAQASYHNHLGEVYRAMRRFSDAEGCFRRAIELKPDYAIAHNALGALMADQDHFEAAADSYRRAIQWNPNLVQAQGNLARALRHLGRSAEAIATFRQALAIDPQSVGSLCDLGALLISAHQFGEAQDCLQRALRIKPDCAEAHSNLGCLFKERGEFSLAVESFRQAIRSRGDLAEAHFNLGMILQEQGQLAEAEDCYRRALRVKTDYAHAHNNLGTLLKRQGKLAEALGCYQRALEFEPNFAEALNNLGNIFQIEGRHAEAMVCYDQTLRIAADYAQAHYNRSLVLLSCGEFASGWVEYEWRLKRPDLRQRTFDKLRWHGEPLAGRTLLVHAEQGFGDTIQFIRYVPLLARFGGKVIVEVQPALVEILRQSGYESVVARGTTLDEFDVHVPLLSLPLIFGTTLSAVPCENPYLAANPQWVEHWREALGATSCFRVGIAWRGSSAYLGDRFRSIPLMEFAPLAATGVELISLQKGPGSEEVSQLGGRFRVRELPGLDEEHGAFVDTAAVMKNLDLVITADTAAGHLAAALGVKVWEALPVSFDWRWMREREDSPWYPTVRLFRQTKLDQWQDVFERMATALGRKLGAAE